MSEPNPEITRVCVVNPPWSVCFNGQVYGPGESVELPLSVSVEWCTWGSVSYDPAFRWTPTELKKRSK
jgi:hypothetical protein